MGFAIWVEKVRYHNGSLLGKYNSVQCQAVSLVSGRMPRLRINQELFLIHEKCGEAGVSPHHNYWQLQLTISSAHFHESALYPAVSHCKLNHVRPAMATVHRPSTETKTGRVSLHCMPQQEGKLALQFELAVNNIFRFGVISKHAVAKDIVTAASVPLRERTAGM